MTLLQVALSVLLGNVVLIAVLIVAFALFIGAGKRITYLAGRLYGYLSDKRRGQR